MLTSLMMFSASALKAQSTNFKSFKVDLAFGYAIPSGPGSKGGVVYATEPKYAINNDITVGLRLEAAVTANSVTDNGTSLSGRGKATSSYLLTGDYYMKKLGLRPFAGLGLGVYNLSGFDLANSVVDVPSSNKFGFAPRVGIETGHFRTAIEYNVIGKNRGVNYDYLAFKVGFFLGGGKK